MQFNNYCNALLKQIDVCLINIAIELIAILTYQKQYYNIFELIFYFIII